MWKRTALMTLLLAFEVGVASAQAPAAPLPAAESSALPSDVASPEAIVQAVYSVISGPVGAPRDWPRLRSLMAPGSDLAAACFLSASLIMALLVSLQVLSS